MAPTTRTRRARHTPTRTRRGGYAAVHRTVAVATLGTALVATACAADSVDQLGGPIAGIVLPNLDVASALVPFDACDDLLDHVKAEANERVGPYGLDGYQYGGPVPMPALVDGNLRFSEFEAVGGAISDDRAVVAPTATAGEGSSSSDPAPAHSTTNVQEAGVDELDVVKTDGDRIVTIAGDRLFVLTGAATEAAVVGDVLLPAWGGQLLIVGDTALVILAGAPHAMPVGAAVERMAPDVMPGPTGTRLLEVDLADPTDPRIVADRTVDGDHVAARLVDGTAHVVVRSAPQQFEFVYPSGPDAEDAAELANRRIIEESTIEDWLPTVRTGESTREEALLECDAMSRPKEFAGFTTVSVLTIDVGDGLDDLGAVGVLADAQHVYASSTSLYVATNDYIEPSTVQDTSLLREVDEQYGTDLHKFDIAGDGPARYRGSGEVDGHPLNQFSMSEHDGVLRIATTGGSPWCCNGGSSSESFVTTLAERDGALVELGRVGGLGKGEQIYAVRFIGEVGYVVTFRQTDPLYVVDLRDPARPAVTGELKIPGYSAYLHPIGDGLLLGVGQDGTDAGQLTGSQVSLFDVSDPRHPQRLAMERLGSGSTTAELDHHAFLWWGPERLAVLPLTTYGAEGQFTGAIGLRVEGHTIERVLQVVNDASGLRPRPDVDPTTTTTTVVPPTTIDATTTTAPPTTIEPPATTAPPTTALVERDAAGISWDESVAIAPEPYPYPLTEPIQRSFVVGDQLYTWSQSGLAVTWLPTLEKIDWIPFQF